MPAYRSPDEADIRRAVVERLRSMRPGARIMHEVNASSFGNRIDVMAVDVADIIAVEIKSKKDKLDRLPAQIKAMLGVTGNVFVAMHERFLMEIRGDFYAPDAARGGVTWVWPIANRKGGVECGINWLERAPWTKPNRCLPPSAIDILWASELREICARLGTSAVSKMTMPVAIDHIRWLMTGEEITRSICAALQARKCPEADLPIEREARETAEQRG